MLKLKTKDKEFCKRLLTDLVNISSVSGEEKEIIGYLEKFFCHMGFKSRRIPRGARRSNLVISIGKGEPMLCINAHADTVPPNGKSQAKASLRKGKLYGLGSADDKGPLVAAICAFKNLAVHAKEDISLKGRIDLFVSIGEERGGEGTEIGIKNGYRCKGALVCEPTGLNIIRAHSGVYFLDITTCGKAAHGSRPWLGKNAILEMIDLVNEIKNVVRKRKKFHLVGEPSLNLGTIQAGDIPNRVPDKCCAKIDMRLMPGEDMASFRKAIDRIFKKKRWRSASYTVMQDREPMGTDKNDILVKALSRAICDVMGRSPKCLGNRGWTDAGNFDCFLNVPAIVFGPGEMGLAHSQNEHIKLEEVYSAAKIYERFIRSYY